MLLSQNQGNHQKGWKQQSQYLDVRIGWQENGSCGENEAPQDADQVNQNGWFCDPKTKEQGRYCLFWFNLPLNRHIHPRFSLE